VILTLREVGEILVESLAPDCPKCGQRLGAIKGANGWFWGCPAYPKCSGSATMNLALRARQASERRERAMEEALDDVLADQHYGGSQ
jgi:ssDNA-binding Zn-finger/Zn-ribbon topoisomerase 1